jgi:general secretion pathway protein D
MNYTKLPKKALLLLATPVMLSLAVPASRLVAQSQTETKIRLMAEGLRARDSGDLTAAKANFEQLLVLAPSDPTVQRLLSGVNEEIAGGAVSAPVATAPVAVSAPISDLDSLPEVTYPPTAESVAAAAAGADRPSALAQAEEARVADLLSRVDAERKAAARLAKDGDFDGAASSLGAAAATLPVNTLTQDTLSDLEKQRNDLLLQKSQFLLAQGDTVGAKAALDAYIAATSPESRPARKQAARIDEAELNPPLQPIEKVSPEFLPEQKNIARLLARGKSQYAAGAIEQAQETFRMVETISADNPEAKYFLKRIAQEQERLGVLNREKTRAQMLQEVANSWQRPGVFVENGDTGGPGVGPLNTAIENKLKSIIIPTVSFTGVDLGQVVSTLAALSEEFDPATDGTKGVNLVLSSPLPGTPVPQVNITLRNLSLGRILDIITENVGYQYLIDTDLVQIRPSGDSVSLSTEQFPITKATLTRMTGLGASSASTPAASSDPFAPAPAAGIGGGGSAGGEADAIRRFFQAAGINFETVPGSSLAYDGTGIIVTQTGRNIEKIRNVLARYNDIRQVEIEAKFMDVTEGALEELGVSWAGSFVEAGNRYDFTSVNRTLAGTIASSTSGSQGSIVTPDQTILFDTSPPGLPGNVDLGGGGALGVFTGGFGDVALTAQLRALSRKQGSDLLSAPKVTVLSGSRATITVAQELRFPQSYSDTESDVSEGGGDAGGGGGVTITPGTPEDFATRNVGVELGVTPTVEEDDYSISLELNPRVTEFEGFVEFGGQSLAVVPGLLGSTVVRLPSGFYQPIFSLREINTRVTVWDGATLVMGGLTREEVRRVDDKVPVLGDIPLLGRAFRSKGETSVKRNLLVFVTANLVSPGGSLKKQQLKGVAPSSQFQNPTVVTPGGSEARERIESPTP